MSPDFALAYSSRAYWSAKQGNRQQAFADFAKAIELDPKAVHNWFERGEVYAAAGDYERAIADLTRAIELGPTDFANYHARAKALARMGKLDDAKNDLKTALAKIKAPDIGYRVKEAMREIEGR